MRDKYSPGNYNPLDTKMHELEYTITEEDFEIFWEKQRKREAEEKCKIEEERLKAEGKLKAEEKLIAVKFRDSKYYYVIDDLS